VTSETYWKIRAMALLVEVAHLRLREATILYHQALEQSGLETENPLTFDDLRHTIQEQHDGVPHSNG
jgi:hypothetical protein